MIIMTLVAEESLAKLGASGYLRKNKSNLPTSDHSSKYITDMYLKKLEYLTKI